MSVFEEEEVILFLVPLGKMMFSPLIFDEGKDFSMVHLLQTELLALQEYVNFVVNH